MAGAGKYFDMLVLMVQENHGWAQVQDCRFVHHIAEHGITFNSWCGVAHPSGPNYRAMISGNTWSGNEFDGVKRPNITNIPGGVDYRVYKYRGEPAIRHNPFLDMNDDAKAKSFVDGPLTDAALAPLTYLGMDDANNAHNGPLSTADANAMRAIAEFEKLTAGDRKIFLILFDEAYGKDYSSNHVFAGMLGTGITPRQIHTQLTHYSLAQFLASNWGLAIDEMHVGHDTYPDKSLLDLT